METVLSCNICRSDEIQAVDPQWNFCRCGACGYVFDHPRPAIEELVAFYSQPAKYDSWLSEEQARDQLWKRRLKQVLSVTKQGSLLDVGAGIGQFLDLARPHFSSVSGTEVSYSSI